jgi:hypothetical protein
MVGMGRCRIPVPVDGYKTSTFFRAYAISRVLSEDLFRGAGFR